MARFVAVLPLEPLDDGVGFSLSSWPLHLTIVPNFETHLAPEAVGDFFRPLPPPMDAVVASDALFGPHENTRVALIEPSAVLEAAHRRLVAAVQHAGGRFVTPDYPNDGYRPHITATKRASAVEGECLHLSQLALVDMQPRGDAGLRHVVWTAALGDSLT